MEESNERLLDYVKFEWRNRHGAWLDTEWITVLSSDDAEQIKAKATIGRPGLTALSIVERVGMPEDVRTAARHMVAESDVVLYDHGNTMDGEQFITAVRDRLDR